MCINKKQLSRLSSKFINITSDNKKTVTFITVSAPSRSSRLNRCFVFPEVKKFIFTILLYNWIIRQKFPKKHPFQKHNVHLMELFGKTRAIRNTPAAINIGKEAESLLTTNAKTRFIVTTLSSTEKFRGLKDWDEWMKFILFLYLFAMSCQSNISENILKG